MTLQTKTIAASIIVVSLGVTAAAFANTKPPLSSELSIAQVTEIALAAKPGEIEEIELERDNGRVVFDVEIETADGDYEVVIDAVTGEVLETEAESGGWGDDDDDNDKDDNN